MVRELRLVRYFVAVAQERNVTRAAERLHLSQPALSAAVKQLERQLGVTLLDRSGRELTLTPAGQLLLHRGRELLEQAEARADDVRMRGTATSARLRVGLSPTARYGIGLELVAACAAARASSTRSPTCGFVVTVDIRLSPRRPQPGRAAVVRTADGLRRAVAALPHRGARLRRPRGARGLCQATSEWDALVADAGLMVERFDVTLGNATGERVDGAS